MTPLRTFFSWERGSHIATILSGFAALVAIYIGVQQGAEQNMRSEQERLLRNEENRPYLAVDSTKVVLFNEGKWEGANAWEYQLKLKNIGVRPAVDVHCLGFLIGGTLTAEGREDFSEIDTNKVAVNMVSNPINHDGIEDKK